MAYESIEGRVESLGEVMLSSQEQTVAKELSEIIAVAARKASDRSSGIERDDLLRKRLSESSDWTIAKACVEGIRYSKQELVERLKGGKDVPLEPLFELMLHFMLRSRMERKNDLIWFELIAQDIARHTPGASQEEIVDVVLRYGDTIIKRTRLLEEILSWRDDMDAVIEKVIAGIPLERPEDLGNLSPFGEDFKRGMIWRLGDMKARAVRIKAEREQTST